MHTKPLLAQLERYLERHDEPEELAMVGRIRALVDAHTDCFERTCLPGHITASSWILSPERDRFLLTHHKKLGRWLQLGGHADGDPDVLQVALREAREESGMSAFGLIDPGFADGDGPTPIDVDVHRIPARPGEPEHEHHDIRYLLVAEAGQPLVMSDESSDLAWFARPRLDELDPDESLVRLARKAGRQRLGPVHPLG